MENYPDNSKSKPPVKKAPEYVVAPVVNNPVERRKTSRTTRFIQSFDFKALTTHVYRDIFVPGARNVFWDVSSSALRGAIFKGEQNPGYGQRTAGSVLNSVFGQVQYNQYNPAQIGAPVNSQPQKNQISPRAREMHDFGEFILATRVEGLAILEALYDIITTFEQASVKNLYELLNIAWDHPDLKWGWTSIAEADVRQLSDGRYLLVLPRPVPID